jgi:hypothetical protein
MNLTIDFGFYVYQHRRLDSGEVFYVGKGCDDRAWSVEGRNHLWRRIACDCGRRVEIVRVGLSEKDAFDLERRMIHELRSAGVQLANIQSGRGAGSNETRKRLIVPTVVYNGENYYRWKQVNGRGSELATVKIASKMLGIPIDEAQAIADGYKLSSSDGWCIYKPRGTKA